MFSLNHTSKDQNSPFIKQTFVFTSCLFLMHHVQNILFIIPQTFWKVLNLSVSFKTNFQEPPVSGNERLKFTRQPTSHEVGNFLVMAPHPHIYVCEG